MTVSTLNNTEQNALLQAAHQVAYLAYAPYSNFRVGAAVLGQQATYTGANIENASYGLALCAERVALATAIAQGERTIRAIAIACIDAPTNGALAELMPCGACRQWIAELAPQAVILIHGTPQVFTVTELLPFSFQLPQALSSCSQSSSD